MAMAAIEPGDLVVVHCTNPREKMWGVLLRLDSVGVVVRGLDLASVEDWLRQQRTGGVAPIEPSTFFLPAHRLIRIDLDETGTLVSSYGDRYFSESGRDVREALLGGAPIDTV
jgi:hypothetical protein